MPSFEDWDKRFLSEAARISDWSKDPSTKVGCLIVKDRQILSTGFNGFPRGIADLASRLNNREERLLRTVHAEGNAVAQAARNGVSLKGSTAYVFPFIPCSSCCSLLIQAGIVRVVVPDTPIPSRWAESFGMSKSMFDEVDISLVMV